MSQMEVMSALAAGAAPPLLPFDLTKGQPMIVLPVDDHEIVATVTIAQLLQMVPDPRKAENPKEVASDPVLAAYAPLRAETQRMVQGRKARNARDFARYIVDGLKGDRPIMLPPVTLYHPVQLETIKLPNGLVIALVPYGDFLIAIDGETQRIAWQIAAQEHPSALGHRIKVVIHHGKPTKEARQGFYDLNTREVKPNAAVAIAMDTLDPATRITRRVMEESAVLAGGGVNLMRRQLRRTDQELMTISGLRTGIVTTILGTPGLQVGSRPIDRADLHGAEENDLGNAVVEVWSAILELLEAELEPDRRPQSVVSAPAILAGIGVVAHHAVTEPPRRDAVAEWTPDEVVEHLEGVNWNRTTNGGTKSPWDGVAGKFTPSGRFSIAGPKEVGYLVAEALESPESPGGRQVRS